MLRRRVTPGANGIARVGARQIYIIPTRAGLVFGATLLVMLLGSLNYQNNLGLLFTGFFAAVGLLAMHHTWFNLLGVELATRAGAPVFARAPAGFEILLGTPGRRARYDLGVRASGRLAVAAYLPPGERHCLKLHLPTIGRGRLALPELRLETRHPLHLFRAWTYVSGHATVLVYPQPTDRAESAAATAGEHARAGRQTHKGSEDYAGARGYRPGDAPRDIDWKALARERGLLVKDYTREQGGDLWADWFRLPALDTERRLSLLTRQVLDASATGARFGLRLPGLTLKPAADGAHLRRCLERLALFEDGTTPGGVQT